MKGVKFAVKDGGTGVKGNQPGAVGIIHAGEDEDWTKLLTHSLAVTGIPKNKPPAIG